MKHVQPPPDGEVLPLDPADDDPLLPRRSAAAIWLALTVACTSSVLCMARSERNFAIVNVLRREGLQNAGVAIKLFPRSRWLCHENRLWPLSIWKSQF
jgi:hypothetical protein